MPKLVKWGKYSYYAFQTVNNDSKLVVVAFDSDNIEVKRWEVLGYRYAKDIEIDEQNQKVNFLMKQKAGEDEASGPFPVSFNWDELRIH